MSGITTCAAGENVADIQVNLTPKGDRSDQSHAIARRVRDLLQPVAAQYGIRMKVAEVPPGPPVLQTLVAEVYGPDYDRQIELAGELRDMLEKTPGVVDVDWYVEDPQPEMLFHFDRLKASLAGVSIAEAQQAVALGDQRIPGRTSAPAPRKRRMFRFDCVFRWPTVPASKP